MDKDKDNVNVETDQRTDNHESESYQSKRLISAFKEDIFKKNIDVGIDIGEATLDLFLEDGFWQNMGIISALKGTLSSVLSVRDRYLAIKTIRFIKEFRSGIIDDDKIAQHKIELENNNKKLNKEIGFIIVALDRHLQSLKSQILARFYAAFIDPDNSCDWDDFCLLADILDEVSFYDLKALAYVYKLGTIEEKNMSEISYFQITRLEKTGLLIITPKRQNSRNFKATLLPQGNIFCELCNISELSFEDNI